ncbi:MAG: acetate--CoA ligase family protein [Armatimonadota bacterium]|nr:acetate--CoA ligase family protein [Armatimonadota bacterium]
METAPGGPRTARAALDRLLAPASVAVVGTSPGGGRGARAHANLLRYGYPGRLYAVNPKYSEVLGARCYPRVADLPEAVDCAVVAVPAEAALRVVEECAALGVGGAIVFASGFAEAGPRGAERQRALEEIAAGRVALCGPNCVGVITVRAATAAFTPPIAFMPPPGGVALVAQSGGLLLEVLAPLLERRTGLSHVIASGNEAATTLEDYLAYLLERPEVEVLATIVEAFRQPARFLEVASRAAALRKPLVVLKTGRSQAGQRAAASHTGALAQDDRVVDAALGRCGALRVRSTDHFVETVTLLAQPRRPDGRGVAIVSSSGGRCALLGDLAAEVGLELAEFTDRTRRTLHGLLPPFGAVNNPLDPTGIVFDQDGVYGPVLSAVAADPGVAVLAIYQLTRNINLGAAEPRTHRSVALAAEVVAAARATDKPVVAFTSTGGGTPDPDVLAVLAGGGVPLLYGVEAALRAVHSLVEYAGLARGVRPLEPGPPSPARAGVQPLIDRLTAAGALSEYDGKRLLRAYGIPVPAGGLATTAEVAVDLARDAGYPVAMKAVSPRLAHKTELGLVRLALADAEAVGTAFAGLWRAAAKHLGADPEGILVERMVAPTAEVIVGARASVFGPVVVFGAGGVLAEILGDAALRLAPVSEDDAQRMIDETRIGRVLGGYRGGPALDVAAVARTVAAVSRIAADLRDVLSELDVNPLAATPDGVVALDCLVTAPPRAARGSSPP